MKAIRFHQRGGPEVLRLEEVADPVPGPGEVLVAVRAVALNHLDLWVRRGLPVAMEMPHVGGSDFAGTVRALGPDVEGLELGQAVVGYPLLGPRGAAEASPVILGEQVNGACCEQIALPAANLLPMPAGLGFVEAAALPVAFLTAWTMLVERARLRRGETLLVTGAAGGVGTAAVQIGRHLGAQVIGASRSERGRQRLRELGADHCVDPGHERLAARTRALSGGRGADVVFEHVGGDAFAESVRAAAPRGRIVTCGASAGAEARLPLAPVFARELSILGVTLGPREDLRRVLELAGRGVLRPVIDRVLDLSECRRAHEILEAGEHFGKIVLRVDAA